MPYSSDTMAARVRRYVLSAAALTSVVLGLELLLFPPPRVGWFLATALMAIGVAVLWALVSLPRARDTEAVEVPPPSASLASVPPNPAPGVPTAPTQPSRSRRATLTEAGADWRILSAPPIPGDETWLSWLPRERRRLGPQDGRLLPGVVDSGGKAGNLVAFPVRDYYGLVPPTGGAADRYLPPPRSGAGSLWPSRRQPPSTNVRPKTSPVEIRLPTGNSAPYTEEELDRMFPPDGGPTVRFLAEPPDRIGGGSPWSSEPPQPKKVTDREEDPLDGIGPAESFPPTEVRGILQDAYLVSDESPPVGRHDSAKPEREVEALPRPRVIRHSSDLTLEATNPIPPHLREAGPLIRFDVHSPRRGGRGGSGSRSVCASCSKVVLNLRMSGPCPRCLRPVCDECLREAFAAHGHGWCSDCSASAATAA